MAAHDYASACAKLQESEQLDPAPGTILNLAVCYERAQKTARAWATYKYAALAAERAGQADRASAAARKASELEATLSRITIVVPPQARVAGLDVRCDGEPVGEASWGVSFPYDPGTHEIDVTAPGRRPWSSRISLAAAAQQASVTVPTLEAVPVVAAAPPPPPPKAEAAADAPASGAHARVAGGILTAIGAVAVGGGIFAGVHAKDVYNQALAACNGGTVCPNDSGISLRNQAQTWATLSTIGFVAGGAILAGGVILLVVAPRDAPPQVALSVSPFGPGLSLAGAF